MQSQLLLYKHRRKTAPPVGHPRTSLTSCNSKRPDRRAPAHLKTAHHMWNSIRNARTAQKEHQQQQQQQTLIRMRLRRTSIGRISRQAVHAVIHKTLTTRMHAGRGSSLDDNGCCKPRAGKRVSTRQVQSDNGTCHDPARGVSCATVVCAGGSTVVCIDAWWSMGDGRSNE